MASVVHALVMVLGRSGFPSILLKTRSTSVKELPDMYSASFCCSWYSLSIRIVEGVKAIVRLLLADSRAAPFFFKLHNWRFQCSFSQTIVYDDYVLVIDIDCNIFLSDNK